MSKLKETIKEAEEIASKIARNVRNRNYGLSEHAVNSLINKLIILDNLIEESKKNA